MERAWARLEAVGGTHRRGYRIALARDLLDDHVVSVWRGRIGSVGVIETKAFTSEQAAVAEVAHKLKRRSSAVRRIGIPYVLVDVGGDPALLPGLDRFSRA